MREILELIFDLSQISNLKFVGGTSLFLQDYKEEISDIDVLVQDLGEISDSFEVITIQEPLYKFSGRQRAYIIREGILVDVFIQENNEETILVDDYAVCCTIQAQIEFYERVLALSMPSENRQRTVARLNYCKTLLEV